MRGSPFGKFSDFQSSTAVTNGPRFPQNGGHTCVICAYVYALSRREESERLTDARIHVQGVRQQQNFTWYFAKRYRTFLFSLFVESCLHTSGRIVAVKHPVYRLSQKKHTSEVCSCSFQTSKSDLLSSEIIVGNYYLLIATVATAIS